MEDLIRKTVLLNATRHKGTPSKGAVIGQLISQDPSIKSRLDEISSLIDKIIEDISKMTSEEQNKMLLKLNPVHEKEEKLLKDKRKAKRQELPDLQGAKDGKVITRMPPGPSKYPHIGHAVSFGINYLYAKKYNGKCILRFDDTNPDVDRQEFVDAIKSDVIDYLGFKPDAIEFASDHIGRMHKYALQLINEDKAYACDCKDMASQRRESIECPHRKKTIAHNIEQWEEMLKGKKDTVLRLKIDMAHKNAVMRDPVIFRMIDSPHYRQESRFKLWPTYDFESAVMDGMLGITHVLRSNEFDSRIELHGHIVDMLNLPRTRFKHYGRTSITGAITQGREIREMIKSGQYIGWDDPRLMTLRALRRRGIVKESFIRLAKTIGMSKTPSNLDFSVIAAINRKILDETASRFFFIQDPVKIKIQDAPSMTLDLNLHPHKRKGGRRFNTTDTFYISRKDLDKIEDGDLIRLMDCLNFRKKGEKYSYDSSDLEKYKKEGKMIIHWLSQDAIDVKIMTPECTIVSGLAEQNISLIRKGEVVQFERYAFCRLDSENLFWFAHR